jgi:hypothetical protein
MFFVGSLRSALYGKVLAINIPVKGYYQLWENRNTHG